MNHEWTYLFSGYQWVEEGRSYTTCVPVVHGRVTGYVVWDYSSDRYTGIDVSPPQ